MTEARTLWNDLMAGLQSHMHGVEWNLNETLSVVQRRWKLVATTTAMGLGLGILMLIVTPPSYQAESLLQINTRGEQVLNVTDVTGAINPTGVDAFIRTELDVIKSRKLAARVINELGLANAGGGTSLVGQVASAVRFFLFPSSQEPAEIQKPSDAKMTRAINSFLSHLSVKAMPRSYSIRIAYEARDPVLAAKVVNAVAQAYLTSQLEDKLDTTRLANTWMNNRLRQMQKDVQAAEMAVQVFREQNGLTQAQGVTLTEQQLSELNTQLIMARTQLAEAEAKITSTARGVSTATEVLSNPLIQNLRLQETEVRRKMSDLSAKYGPRHPLMVTVRNELADVQRKIGEETSKIRGSLDNNLDMARARVNTLEAQLNQLQNKSSLSNNANVQLMELERQAQASRGLYENFLGRSKELAQMDFPKTDARIIYPAEAPLYPSSPKKALVLLLALVLGAALGGAFAMLLEFMDSGFRTSSQLEALAKLPVLGMLSEVRGTTDMAAYVRDKPTSAFTECVRAIRTALRFAKPDSSPRVVLITSSVPQEGKSTFSLSLAQTVAMGSDAKVLVIDADLRRPKLAHQLGLEPRAGLAELLAGTAKLKDVLTTVKGSKIHVVPALANTSFAQELLSSQKMKDLMDSFRKDYDFIVIDSPPVMAVADAATLSPFADAVLFMVRWGSTPRVLVANALRQLQACGVAVAGCVMTRVDMDKQQAYGYGDYGYYYGKYKDYYSD